uniref:Uncharacterized protein n=1 Tax=Meloidogyne incognita TaxID=6306 RepID=A0A914MXS2_MELIC
MKQYVVIGRMRVFDNRPKRSICSLLTEMKNFTQLTEMSIFSFLTEMKNFSLLTEVKF